VDGWIKYHTFGEAQFLNLKAILLKIGLSDAEIPSFLSRHTNLCGPLAVMEYFNVSLEEGFRRWIEFSDEMKTALLSGEATSSGDLVRFFEAFDIGVEERRGIRPLITASNTSQPIIALVAISGGSVSSEGSTAHWIRIKEATENEMVEFYNPYINDYDTVDWETFVLSWERVAVLSGNEGANQLFITTARY